MAKIFRFFRGWETVHALLTTFSAKFGMHIYCTCVLYDGDWLDWKWAGEIPTVCSQGGMPHSIWASELMCSPVFTGEEGLGLRDNVSRTRNTRHDSHVQACSPAHKAGTGDPQGGEHLRPCVPLCLLRHQRLQPSLGLYLVDMNESWLFPILTLPTDRTSTLSKRSKNNENAL